ncbi:MAG: CCA tRNA nucleotidyltransferase [Acidobacteriia bacterium]|nr:CCA tRNA nucleotidyltransferase [Terriglobia bacterium]
MADFIYLMETRLTPDQQRAVALVTDVARAHQMNVYLTGGAVRDIISGFIIRDLDFSVQGNALKLQKDFEKAGAVVEAIDETTRTLMVLLPGNVRGEVTGTRSEKYDKPGRPPEITPGTIYDDMRRRDFTVNAMALSLNPGSRGLLTDPFNGMADIESKLLRVLHNYAFYEDPSRLIRATRLATRFHWALEERTQARYDAAKENNYIDNVSDRTLGHEVEQLAHEDDPIAVLKALDKEGWLKILAPHFSLAKVDSAGLTQMFKVKQQMQDVGMNPDASPIVMHFLTRKLPDKDISAIQRQIPNKGFVERWRSLEDSTKAFTKQAAGKELTTPSAAWKFLLQSKPEDLLFAAITSRPAVVEQRLKNFLTKWPLVKQKLPFVEMAELKITSEHPEYRKIMGDAFLLLLDGKLRNHNEIIRYLEPYKPPEPPPPPPPVRRGRVARKEAPAAGADQPKKRGRKPKALINVAAAAVAAAPAAAAPAAVPAKEPAKADAKAKPPAPAKQKHAPPKKAEKARKPAKKADKKAAKKDKKKGKKK